MKLLDENWNGSDNYNKCDINIKTFKYTEHNDDYVADIDPYDNFHESKKLLILQG